ncbi:hypothetical protein DER45DRAFT_626932 [Fusarium avenaceum]|nr:hypothetical protein DER45DRAFT_626932 [Fusarium avenaceum]
MAAKRSALADIGFFYDEDLKGIHQRFPPHVEILEQSMLDFACHDFDSAPKRDIRIQNEANRLAKGGFKEDHWESLFREHFFGPLLQRERDGEEMSRGSSRCNYYYDNMVFETDALWGEFRKEHKGMDLDLLSTPKPDIVLFLPVYHVDSHLPTVTNPDSLEWHTDSNAALVETFSWSNLRDLYKYGLLPSPYNVFDKNEEPKESDLRCFPWLIVEYKKKESDKYSEADFKRLAEAVYCQAVNASGCAVKLHERAVRFALALPRDAHIPPVTTVTTVGPLVKVWITYFDRGFYGYRWRNAKGQQGGHIKEGYMMQCIWTGNMTNLHDIQEFRLILENTHTWAARVFRPLISTYVEQWRYAHSHDYTKEAMVRQEEKLQLSRTACRYILGVMGDQIDLNADYDLRNNAITRLVELCDAFFIDADRVIEEEIEAAWPKKGKAASPKSGRRRLTVSKTRQARSVSPGPASSTPRSTPRRAPRKKPQTPTGDSSSRVKTAALDLKESIAGAEPKRRESGSDLLDPSPAMIPGLVITHECADDEEALVDSSSATSSSIDTPGDERSAEVSIPGAFPPMTPAKHVQSSVSEIIDGDDGEVFTQWQSLKGFASSIFLRPTL